MTVKIQEAIQHLVCNFKLSDVLTTEEIQRHQQETGRPWTSWEWDAAQMAYNALKGETQPQLFPTP